MEDLTLAESIGQMMIISVVGTDIDEELVSLINDINPGGIILFKENYDSKLQIKRFCRNLQKIAKTTRLKIPLFISVDQEGGSVIRLPPPFTQLPTARELGAKGSDFVYNSASQIATELKEVGINMNHAPVLDIDTNNKNPIIGDRSFGNEPDIVTQMGIEFSKGLQDNNIISTGKHFPGHGHSETDSHKILPIVRLSRERLLDVEIYPFKVAILQGIDTIMSAHVLYPALDKEYPATLSKKIITDILRIKLGFKGVIITDDLSMKAITSYYCLDEACYLAVRAGINMLLVTHQSYKVYREIRDNLLNSLNDTN